MQDKSKVGQLLCILEFLPYLPKHTTSIGYKICIHSIQKITHNTVKARFKTTSKLRPLHY